jgi:pyruvate/2-oxoglutarate dehydrogenase complex dihydrolipoamide acyltransferase (E2) component
VVHDADAKRLAALAREIHDLAARARSKQLSPDDLAEGTFTIEAAGNRKRFTMRAYSGGPLTLKEYDAPVIVDLAGVTISAQNLPTPHNHDLENVIGETDKIEITANGIEATGFLDTGTDRRFVIVGKP